MEWGEGCDSAIINIARSLNCSIEKAIHILNVPADMQEQYRCTVEEKLKP